MSQHERAKFNAQISEEASEWFVEFRLGEIDASGRRDFAAWIRTSPDHLRAYLEIAEIWSQGGSMQVHSDLDSDALIALARTEGNVVSLESSSASTVSRDGGHSQIPRRLISRRWQLTLAAALVMVVVGGATMTLWLLGRGAVYATAVGERRVLRLEDGSSVELNSRSRIRVRFSEGWRNVDLLEGQVLFHVAKDAQRPFVVRSEQLRVRAVGTEFDVNRRTTGTIVTVVEGRVAVYRDGTSEPGPSVSLRPRAKEAQQDQDAQANQDGQALSAGEQLTVSDQTGLSQPLHTSPATATAWTQGQVVLESATLTDAAEDFNRYSARRLIVDDRGARALRLSGVFATDPEFLLRYLRQRPDITVQESATEVRIIRRD